MSGGSSHGGGNFSTHVYKTLGGIATLNLGPSLVHLFARGIVDLSMRLQLEDQISPINE